MLVMLVLSIQRLRINGALVVVTSVVNVFAQINSITMLNETNFKVWKKVIEIVLGCMDLDLVLWVKEPILLWITFKRLKLRNENALTGCAL
ncbi:hypothetical protein CR513_20953, partial [Mucuna pruriens]